LIKVLDNFNIYRYNYSGLEIKGE
jgi:hypothetical protein